MNRSNRCSIVPLKSSFFTEKKVVITGRVYSSAVLQLTTERAGWLLLSEEGTHGSHWNSIPDTKETIETQEAGLFEHNKKNVLETLAGGTVVLWLWLLQDLLMGGKHRQRERIAWEKHWLGEPMEMRVRQILLEPESVGKVVKWSQSDQNRLANELIVYWEMERTIFISPTAANRGRRSGIHKKVAIQTQKSPIEDPKYV